MSSLKTSAPVEHASNLRTALSAPSSRNPKPLNSYSPSLQATARALWGERFDNPAALRSR